MAKRLPTNRSTSPLVPFRGKLPDLHARPRKNSKTNQQQVQNARTNLLQAMEQPCLSGQLPTSSLPMQGTWSFWALRASKQKDPEISEGLQHTGETTLGLLGFGATVGRSFRLQLSVNKGTIWPTNEQIPWTPDPVSRGDKAITRTGNARWSLFSSLPSLSPQSLQQHPLTWKLMVGQSRSCHFLHMRTVQKLEQEGKFVELVSGVGHCSSHKGESHSPY